MSMALWHQLWKVFLMAPVMPFGLNPVDDSTESVKRILNKFEEFRSEWEIQHKLACLLT